MAINQKARFFMHKLLLPILTCFVFIFLTLSLPTPVYSQDFPNCSWSNSLGMCKPGQSTCLTFSNYDKWNQQNAICCTNATACQEITDWYSQNPTAFGLTNPTVGCPNGINTALGCIPFELDQFTPALLGFLAGLVGAVALAVMLAATVQIMTGAGNPEQVKKGKELFTGAITGLLFIIFSVTLLRLIAGDIIQLPGFIN